MATLNGTSFITEPLTILASREDLVSIIDNLEEKTLSDLDLSGIDCSGISFDEFTIKNVVFSRFQDSSDTRHTISMVSFKNASLENVCFAQSELSRCNFDGAVIQNADFFFSTLLFCRFRDAVGYCLDFRYSSIESCSMSTSTIVMSDFYMAVFSGSTSFVNSSFKYCSLTSATFNGNCITMDNLRSLSSADEIVNKPNISSELKTLLSRNDSNVFLIQDDYTLYHRFNHIPNWNRRNPCSSTSHLNTAEKNDITLESKQFISKESMQQYRVLSGLYTGMGLFKDSNRAYRMTKRKELEHYWLSVRVAFKKHNYCKCFSNVLKCTGPLIVKSLGYGYKWSIIVVWFLTLIIGYSIYHYASTASKYIDSLTGSMNNSMGPNPEFIARINEFIGSIEPTIGTLLIGFLGFVIANKIRNNS